MSPRYERRQRGGGGALLLLIAAAALVVAVLVGLWGKGLVTVAACACCTVFLVEKLLPLLPL